MEQVTISLTTELKDSMNRELAQMNLTLEEFLEQTFFSESKNLDTAKKITMTDIFLNYEGDEGDYQGESYDWGSPVGREVW